MKFRNHHDGARDFPTLGLAGVEPGEVFEATGDDAESLLAQGFPRVDKPKSRNDEKKD